VGIFRRDPIHSSAYHLWNEARVEEVTIPYGPVHCIAAMILHSGTESVRGVGMNRVAGEVCANRCRLHSSRKKVLSDMPKRLYSDQLSFPVTS